MHVLHPVGHSIHRPWQVQERFRPRAFDIATAKQFTSTNVFGVNVAENFTTADIHGKIIIGIFVALMCFCLWFMQYNSMKRNMAQSAANKAD